jgi:hypothetical protein
MSEVRFLSPKTIEYRRKTFRITSGLQIKNVDQAIQFVEQRGFIFFWPIKGREFPSLWAGVAGDRPVPNDHDDPSHITWNWKDQMLGKRCWYYGRYLCRKNTMISLDTLPYFYALSPNYGEYKTDYLIQYEQGQLTAESKAIYEALLYEGALDTLSLRRAARMSSSASSGRFQRALDQLQVELKILPTGISEAGAWRYAFIYDIIPRHFPDLETRARSITEMDAQALILLKFIESLGETNLVELKRFFGWKEKVCLNAIKRINATWKSNIAVIEQENLTYFILDKLLPEDQRSVAVDVG